MERLTEDGLVGLVILLLVLALICFGVGFVVKGFFIGAGVLVVLAVLAHFAVDAD